MRRSSRHSRNGIALVIVLSMIVLITLLVVSFTSSMRTERQASRTMSENERTKLVAETALAHAIGILSSNIPQPVPPIQPGSAVPTPVNWAVSPGLLNIITGPSNVTQIPLSTNLSIDYASNTKDANLNLLQASTNQYPIAGTGEPMYVAWAPLLQNPAATASSTNPIAARYAFWIDDENAKINVNTAYGKPSGMNYTDVTPGIPNLTPGVITETATPPVGLDAVVPLGNPGSVNLDVFGSTFDKKGLLSFLKTYGATSSPEASKAFFPGTDSAKEALYQQNKFSLTATSRDPEFNTFGKSRLFMYAGSTGQLGGAAGGGMFQRFRDLDAPMYFHGSENRDPAAYPGGNPSQDYAAMYYTAANLSSILNRKDWPGMPARSFVNKWGGNDTQPTDMGHREADQVAWNTVTMGTFSDYGAYSTATPGLVTTLGNHLLPNKTGSSGSINYPNAAVPVGSLSGRAIVPAAPQPMIDEICLNILPEPTSEGSSKYYLQFRASYGVWLPPGYPTADFSQDGCDFFVGLTHLEYSVDEAGATICSQASSAYLNNAVNGDGGVKKMQAYDVSAADTLSPDGRMTLLSIRNVPNPDLTPQFYARNGSGFSSSPVARSAFNNDIITVTMRMRLFVHSVQTPYISKDSRSQNTQAPPTQLIPLWDTHDPGSTAAKTTWNPTVVNDSSSQVYKVFYPPPDDHPPFDATALGDCVEFKFDLDLSKLNSTYCTRSLRIADPRTGGLSRMWKPSWKDAVGNDLPGAAQMSTTDSLGAAHNAETAAAITAGLALEKFAYIDMKPGALSHPSIGMFSIVPTGMQRGLIGSNLKLQPNSTPGELPDWLLIDLFAPTVSPASASTLWPDIVKMNGTAGKINANAAIFPNSGAFSPPSRLLPLQALFANTPASSTVQNIVNHTLATGGQTYAGTGKFYNYPGEICEIQGVADTGSTDWEREATIRNFASAVTTKSNTFCVWGVAQSIKKLSTNHQYGQYETGDLITGEKRFQAIVARSVWPGADNVAGNGHTSSTGTYDLLTQGTTQPGTAPSAGSYNWEKLDGPDAPTYPVATSTDANNVTMDATYDPYNKTALSNYTGATSASLETANNPVRATMKYRVVYFKYLE